MAGILTPTNNVMQTTTPQQADALRREREKRRLKTGTILGGGGVAGATSTGRPTLLGG